MNENLRNDLDVWVKAFCNTISCLVTVLEEKNLIDSAHLVEKIQHGAVAYRLKQNDELANALGQIANHLLASVPVPPKRPSS